MAGLALGSWAFGQRIGRWARPLRLYAWLELGIGLWAVLVPLIFAGLGPVYRLLWTALGAGPPLFGVARFVVCLVVLLPATVLMGATLPVLSQHWSRGEAPLVGGIGRLYGVNLIGAVVGVFFTGFIFLPRIGYAGTITVAVAVNFLVAALAFAMSRRLETSPAHEALPAGAAPEPRETAADLSGEEVGTLVALGFTGFAAMVLQVGWTRMLGLVVGPSVYAFSVVLATFLVGLGLGSLAVSFGMDRWRWDGRRTFWILAAATGLLTLGTLGGAAELPYLFARLFYRWEGSLAPELMFGIQATVCAAAMFLPTLAMGGLFPAALAAAGLSHERAGAAVGRLYAGNTVGAVLGAFAGGFLLIPTLGLGGTITTAAFVYLAVGAVFGVGIPGRSPRLALARAVAVSAAGLAAVVLMPGWNQAVMASGIYESVTLLSEHFTRDEFRDRTEESWEVLYYKDGHTSTVTVAWRPDRLKRLGDEDVPNLVYTTDGKADATSVTDMPTQVLLAQAPLLLHPDPGTALVIGLASGTTAGSVLTHPVKRLDVVEIEPASEPASRLFDFVSGRPLDDPRTHLFFADARTFLQGTSERYDVIVSEPSNPWMAGPANLFTQEFFEIGRRALTPGGIFAQWIHTDRLHPQLLRSALATFHSVFPQVYVFESRLKNDLILVGSRDPIVLDVARIAARWQRPSVLGDLARVGLPEFGDVMAQVRIGPREVAALVEGARINTDDNGLLRFGAPLFRNAYTVFQGDELMAPVSRGVGEYLSFPGATPQIEARFLSYLAGAYRALALPMAASVAQRLAGERDQGAPGGTGN